ncbi:MAG: hypothetical protein HYZ53_27255 [Planctomycetes bacterium]|nr:hypothetical protein [Planctomycetota bacterium]
MELRRMLRCLLPALLLTLALPVAARAGETPPPGPPWILDFPTALAKAAEERKPLFLYFTKTY